MKVDTKNYTIDFFSEGMAYFEHKRYGDEEAGRLWLEGKKVTDYDGVYELDIEIVNKLEELGYEIVY